MTSINLNGIFYPRFMSISNYSDESQSVIVRTVEKLLDQPTDENRPGMLLGKIQSGKTKTFLGIMALAFDNGFDVVVVFTKGTVALAKQTLDRINKEFLEFRNEDLVQVFDVLGVQDLTKYELTQKLVFVAKKETHNISRLSEKIFNKYKELSGKHVLIIDDEADYASIGFKKSKDEGVVIKPIAGKIDIFRSNLMKPAFLQVTATPYSLYLQPDDLVTENQVFKPVRPAFTELVPVHDGYIGGDYYFYESQEENTIASFLYQPVPKDELIVLEAEDRRRFKIEDCLLSAKIKSMRSAIINFVVGGIIRRLQDRSNKKYSFIIHTKTSKDSHEWQELIVATIIEKLIEAAKEGKVEFLEGLIKPAYDDLAQSIKIKNLSLPLYDDVFLAVYDALAKGYVMISRVNSDKDVRELLDDQGQLKLRNPLNIFIGGQILDRGITIANLIGFFYGRDPKKFQQDTVLQHSRMFGFRPIEDLAVTRFYTSLEIYDAMKKIQDIDSTLRKSVQDGDQEVIFIQKDESGKLVPCSPNKILLSTTVTLRPFKRLLPIGFQTDYKTNIEHIIKDIDKHLERCAENFESPFLIDVEKGVQFIDSIYKTLKFEDGCNIDLKSFIACLEHLSRSTNNQSQKGKIWCLVRKDRNISRIVTKGHAIFSDAPDTAKTDGKIARQVAIDVPILMLFRQNGSEELGWKGTPFYWPVMYAPKNTQVTIFASNLDQ